MTTDATNNDSGNDSGTDSGTDSDTGGAGANSHKEPKKTPEDVWLDRFASRTKSMGLPLGAGLLVLVQILLGITLVGVSFVTDTPNVLWVGIVTLFAAAVLWFFYSREPNQ